MELSSIGDRLNTFTVSPDRDSKFPFGEFVVDPELTAEDVLIASRIEENEIAHMQVNLHKSKPSVVTITTQTKGWMVDVSVFHGHCGEES